MGSGRLPAVSLRDSGSLAVMSPGGHGSQRVEPTSPGEVRAEPHRWKGPWLPRRPPAGSGLQVLPSELQPHLWRPACVPSPGPSAGLQSSASWQGLSYNYLSPLAGIAATPRTGHWPQRWGGRGCRQAPGTQRPADEKRGWWLHITDPGLCSSWKNCGLRSKREGEVGKKVGTVGAWQGVGRRGWGDPRV